MHPIQLPSVYFSQAITEELLFEKLQHYCKALAGGFIVFVVLMLMMDNGAGCAWQDDNWITYLWPLSTHYAKP